MLGFGAWMARARLREGLRPSVATVVLSLVTLASWSFAFDEEAKTDDKAAAEKTEPEPDPGLAELLPYMVPDDLGAEQWEKLGGNWKDWSAGMATSVAAFYEGQFK